MLEMRCNVVGGSFRDFAPMLVEEVERLVDFAGPACKAHIIGVRWVEMRI